MHYNVGCYCKLTVASISKVYQYFVFPLSLLRCSQKLINKAPIMHIRCNRHHLTLASVDMRVYR